jgi:hypothetical protein
MTIGPFSESHDEFHTPPEGAGSDWAETCWFTFSIPERRLSGQIYAYFKPTLGVAAAATHFWDETGDQIWNCLYSRTFWHLPMPRIPLSRFELASGARCAVLSPGLRYAVGYDDPDGDEVHVDLTFTGIAEPHLLGDSHLDQPGRFTGEIVLRGESLAVDAFGCRDRSWGPRPQFGIGIGGTPSKRGGYSYATASSEDAFHAITMDFGDGAAIVIHGYLIREGLMGHLLNGRRDVVERDLNSGAPTKIRLEATDSLGRTFDASGVALNRFGFLVNPNLWTWNCLTEWSWDGISGFGEDHDNWSVAGQREFSRAHLEG